VKKAGAVGGWSGVLLPCVLATLGSLPAHAFGIEEATIADVHRAIQSGETTCTQIVEAYFTRAKANNGICTALVTQDGTVRRAGKRN
jgi:amidase